MFEGQNPFRIRRTGPNTYQISNVNRSIIPTDEQSRYCSNCEVRQLCQVEGIPPINRRISLTEVLIARCQRALQRANGMSVPVKDQDFAPTIIAKNVGIPCLQNSAKDPHPDVKGDDKEYWWQNY